MAIFGRLHAGNKGKLLQEVRHAGQLPYLVARYRPLGGSGFLRVVWFDQIVFWHWWILAGALLILELIAPTYFFLWLGIAAAAIGFLALAIVTISVEVQLLAFGVLALIAVVAWRRYRETQLPETDQPNLNQRRGRYEGRVLTLDHPIENGIGKVVVDDSTWRVKGPDLPAGTRVRVRGIDGVVFLVEPSDSA